jgi:hypothetical protein
MERAILSFVPIRKVIPFVIRKSVNGLLTTVVVLNVERGLWMFDSFELVGGERKGRVFVERERNEASSVCVGV